MKPPLFLTITLAFLGLTGCPTAPKEHLLSPNLMGGNQNHRQPSDSSSQGFFNFSRRHASPSRAPASPSPAGRGIPPSLSTLHPVPLPDHWVLWDRWAAAKGWGKPAQTTNYPLPVYELRNHLGILKLTMGSRVAQWNGLSLALGFIPQITNGAPVVHALDLTKNFEPLFQPKVIPRFRGQKRVVVIDPGHGGENTGAKTAVGNAFEKDLTLDWALRAEPLLRGRGWTTYLTRTNDSHVSLSNRVAFAELKKADLFISLHFNSVHPALARPEHEGIETYCLTPAGMPSNLIREFDDDPKLVYPNNSFDADNLYYALRLHKSLIEKTQSKDRGIRRARFMTVLQGQKCPAVLLEGGYLTHSKEARRISTEDYRQRLAEALAHALD